MTSQSSQAILELYREIVAVTASMLNAARVQDWTAVLQLGHTYCESVEKLRTVGGTQPLDDAERRQKYDMLVQILENDANTRDLAIPELARMSQLLGRMKREQALLNTYGFRTPAI